MGQSSEIQWCDSTVNPTTGCDGCELWGSLRKSCYAGALHEGRLAKSLPTLYAASFDEVRLAPGRMAKAAAWPDLAGKARPDKPWLDGMPRVIFVGDMGDIFSKDVPFDYLLSEVMATAAGPKGYRHIWMLLTKQASRMRAFDRWLAERGVDWPANVWPGVSVTNRKTVGRLDPLREMRAETKFVSAEPLIEAVWLGLGQCRTRGLKEVRLVIIGGESRQGAEEARPFNVDWARGLLAECRQANVHGFLKQVGNRPYVTRYNENSTTDPGDDVFFRLKDHHGGDWGEWTAHDLRRREFPAMPVPSEPTR